MTFIKSKRAQEAIQVAFDVMAQEGGVDGILIFVANTANMRHWWTRHSTGLDGLICTDQGPWLEYKCTRCAGRVASPSPKIPPKYHYKNGCNGRFEIVTDDDDDTDEDAKWWE